MKKRFLLIYAIVFLPMLLLFFLAVPGLVSGLHRTAAILLYSWFTVLTVSVLVLIPLFFIVPAAEVFERIRRRSGATAGFMARFPSFLLGSDRSGRAENLLRELEARVRELAEENRRLGEERLVLQGVFGSITQFIIVIDSDMNIRNANAAFLESFAADPASVTGRNLFQVFRTDKKNLLRDRIAATIKGGLMQKVDNVKVKSGGTGNAGSGSSGPGNTGSGGAGSGGAGSGDAGSGPFTARVSVYPFVLSGPAGRSSGAVLFVENVTDRTELQRRMGQVEKLSSLGVLSAGIAHEVRNPLAGIAAAIEVLKMKTPPKLAKSFDAIQRDVDRINNIIRNLLDFARPHAVRTEPLGLSPLIDELVVFFKRTHRGIAVSWAPPERDLVVSADRNQIYQVFLNIMLNAADAIRDNIFRKEDLIGVKLSAERNEAVVSFTDTGIGMSPKIIRDVFVPFFTTKQSGTGLGLAVSYRIVEAHAGRITIESKRNVGSTVSVRLPLSGAGK